MDRRMLRILFWSSSTGVLLNVFAAQIYQWNVGHPIGPLWSFISGSFWGFFMFALAAEAKLNWRSRWAIVLSVSGCFCVVAPLIQLWLTPERLIRIMSIF